MVELAQINIEHLLKMCHHFLDVHIAPIDNATGMKGIKEFHQIGLRSGPYHARVYIHRFRILGFQIFLEPIDFLLQVHDEHVVGHDKGNSLVLGGRKLFVRDKMIGFHGEAKVMVPAYKVFVILGCGPSSIVVVKFNVVGEKGLVAAHLLFVVFDQNLIGIPGPFALDIEDLVIINEFAEDHRFDVLEKIDLGALGGERFPINFLAEFQKTFLHDLLPVFGLSQNVLVLLFQLVQLVLKFQ